MITTNLKTNNNNNKEKTRNRKRTNRFLNINNRSLKIAQVYKLYIIINNNKEGSRRGRRGCKKYSRWGKDIFHKPLYENASATEIHHVSARE